MPHARTCQTAAILFSAAAIAQGPTCHGLNEVTNIVQQVMAAVPGTLGANLEINQHGQNLYRQSFGSYSLQQVVAMASATKPMSATVLMSLVDQQLLALDDPVAMYLPEYSTPPLDTITLRMCFAHTSGLPNSSQWVSNHSINLRTAAQNIANEALQFTPGTRFSYGSVGMHVAGAVCEVVAGQPWAQLFDQRVATPLGLTDTSYTAHGMTNNPRISGGAVSSLRDYSIFFETLRNGGIHNNVRILSEAAVEEMMTDQTSHLPITFSPNPQGAPYGIGLWVDQQDSAGRATHVSSPGFWGFCGWIDRAREVTGVFVVASNGQLTWPYFERIVAVADAALPPVGTACHGTGSPACAADTWLNATTWPRVGLTGFGLRTDHAPAGSLGVMWLAYAPATAPSTVLDLSIWLPSPFAATAGLVADANGHAMLPVSLANIAAGQSFAVQSAWLDTGGCGQFGVRASHALTLTIQP